MPCSSEIPNNFPYVYIQNVNIMKKGIGCKAAPTNRFWDGPSRVRFQAGEEVHLFSTSSPKCPDRHWNSPSLLLRYRVLFFRAPSGKAWSLISLPSTNEVTSEWSYTSSPSVRLRGVQRQNYIFSISLHARR
jgi:hypothetical protein